jgi:hypothetical protein
MRKLGLRPNIPFLGTFVSNFRHFVFTVCFRLSGYREVVLLSVGFLMSFFRSFTQNPLSMNINLRVSTTDLYLYRQQLPVLDPEPSLHEHQPAGQHHRLIYIHRQLLPVLHPESSLHEHQPAGQHHRLIYMYRQKFPPPPFTVSRQSDR